jgi:alcohol dehydrogenase class IV
MSIASIDATSASNVRATDPGAGQSARSTAFAYSSQQYRVVFGAGSAARLGEEVERLGIRRVLVLTTREQRDQGVRLGAHLGSRLAGLFSDARMHTPVEVTDAAITVVQAQDIDGFAAIGGGSTVGLGKALSLRTGFPHIAMPTTYAGSEMTPILGETRHGVKTTQRSQDLIPDTVIYDVDLTLGLPAKVSAASGMNAIAHAVEALYAEDANPLTSLMAEEGIAALARALPQIMVSPSDGTARHDALYGAWLCGTCLGAVGMSLHHKLCHVLGGSFDLPHAETHAIVLPHAAAYNAVAAPEAMARVARALGASDAARGLNELARSLRLPKTLAEIGMPESGIDRAADMAVQNAYANPRPVDRASVRELIAAAYRGDAPSLH